MLPSSQGRGLSSRGRLPKDCSPVQYIAVHCLSVDNLVEQVATHLAIIHRARDCPWWARMAATWTCAATSGSLSQERTSKS